MTKNVGLSIIEYILNNKTKVKSITYKKQKKKGEILMSTKQKNLGSNIVIVILILIITISSCIGIYAWARYNSSVSGIATGQIAKWSFKLVDGVTETKDIIDFAITRTDGYGKVTDGKLAPGTFGELEIEIDARGTETILEYIMNIELKNKPTYLKLYSDSEKTKEIEIVDNKFQIKGFMSLEDVKEIRTEKIYWDWPYENGDDITDTNDNGKIMEMRISVTGYEVLEPTEKDEDKPKTLANAVEVGDFVNYDASSNGVKIFTNSNCVTGSTISDTISTNDSFNASAPAQWRVFSVNKQEGKVELIAVDPTTQQVSLQGPNGFLNAEVALNSIGEIYGKGKGATGGRSISLDDILKYSSYDPYTHKNEYSSTGYYGGTRQYTKGKFYKQIMNGNGNVSESVYETNQTIANSTNKITMTQTYCGFSGQNYFSNSMYNLLFKNITDQSSNKATYLLASKCVDLAADKCYYDVYRVYEGGIYIYYGIYDSDGVSKSIKYSVMPIVSLKLNIETTGKDENGVWQLKLD